MRLANRQIPVRERYFAAASLFLLRYQLKATLRVRQTSGKRSFVFKISHILS